MQPLPSQLKYDVLGENDNVPVIISNALTSDQDAKRIKVVKENREAIGWSVVEIKGISPSTYMNNI